MLPLRPPHVSGPDNSPCPQAHVLDPTEFHLTTRPRFFFYEKTYITTQAICIQQSQLFVVPRLSLEEINSLLFLKIPPVRHSDLPNLEFSFPFFR